MDYVLGAIEITEYLDSENNPKKQKCFLMCESCFWCASASDLHFKEDETISKCPLCGDDIITLIPILRG